MLGGWVGAGPVLPPLRIVRPPEVDVAVGGETVVGCGVTPGRGVAVASGRGVDVALPPSRSVRPPEVGVDVELPGTDVGRGVAVADGVDEKPVPT